MATLADWPAFNNRTAGGWQPRHWSFMFPHATTIAAAQPFVLFGPDHFGALLGLVLVSAGLILIARRGSARSRGYAAGALALALAVTVVLQTPYEAAIGVWRVEESLPLHLCDLGLFSAVVALVLAARDSASPLGRRRGAQLAFELTWYWGFAGTLQALLTPSVAEAFPDPMYWLYFVLHGGIIVAALYLAAGCGWRPRPPWHVLLITYALGAPIGLFNWLAGTNYMYLCGPPPTASLYDYFWPWPWALVALAAVGAVLLWLCYVPFLLVGVGGGNQIRQPRLDNAAGGRNSDTDVPG